MLKLNSLPKQEFLQRFKTKVILQSKYLSILVFIMSLVLNSAWAVPPEPVECDSLVNIGDRLKCKQNNVIDQQEYLTTEITTGPLGKRLTTKQVEGLENAKNRAKKMGVRVQADDFKALTKKRKVTCQIKEWDGSPKNNGDGVCEKNEECEEVIGDQIGDDIQPCSPMKGKNKEVCVEICDEEAIEIDDNNYDSELAVDLEQIYDDLTAQTKEANENLENEAYTIASYFSSASNGDACAIVDGSLSRTPFLTFVSLKTLAVTTRGVADIAERGCDQSVLGTNGATVCIAVETIASLAAVAWNAVEEIEGTLDSITIDATIECVKDVRSRLAVVKADINNVKADVGKVNSGVSDVKTEVLNAQSQIRDLNNELKQAREELRTLLEETKELLNTPPGRRPEFPQK